MDGWLIAGDYFDTAMQFDDILMGMFCNKLKEQVILYNSDDTVQRLSRTAVSGYAGVKH